MSIRMICPSCQAKLSIPEQYAGRKGKCPKCQAAIDVPAAVAAAVAEPTGGDAAGLTAPGDDVAAPTDDAERRPCPACGEMIMRDAVKCRFCHEVLDSSLATTLGGGGAIEPEWSRVRTGLMTMYVAIGVIIVAVVMFVLGTANAVPILGGLGLALIVCGGIASLIGIIMCTAAPSQSGAKGLAVGAAVCTLLTGALSGVAEAAENQLLGSVGNLISLAGSILFILFLKRSASYLGSQEIATSAGRFLVFNIMLYGGVIVIVVMALSGAANAVAGVLGIVLSVCFLVSLLWYIRLIKTLADFIRGRLRER